MEDAQLNTFSAVVQPEASNAIPETPLAGAATVAPNTLQTSPPEIVQNDRATPLQPSVRGKISTEVRSSGNVAAHQP